MTTEQIVTALDVGTAHTTALIASVHEGRSRRPTLRVLGVGQTRTVGLRRGVVSDIEETTRSIKRAVDEASRVSGVTPEVVYVGIAGEHVSSMISPGAVGISGTEITRADVERVNGVARARVIPHDRELLHALPLEYRVDGADGILDPVGMIGTRLETDVFLVTIGSSPAVNLRKSVERAGYVTRELVLEPFACSYAVLSEEDEELGVALIELGAGTTDVAVFHEGKIRHLATIPFGGNAVTGDIVQGLGVSQSDAETLKEAYGCADESMVQSDQLIEIPASASHGKRHLSRQLMTHIIHQRMDEMFGRIHRDLQRVGFAGRLTAGFVLTGGGASLEGVSELAAEIFGASVRVGMPGASLDGLAEALSDPRFATVTGLAHYGAHRTIVNGVPSRRAIGGQGVEKLVTRARDWLQDFF